MRADMRTLHACTHIAGYVCVCEHTWNQQVSVVQASLKIKQVTCT